MLEIEEPKIHLLATTEDNTVAVLRFENLLSGMAASMGNALVRTLLKFIPGYAPQCYSLNVTVGNDVKTIGKFDSIPTFVENSVELSRNISNLILSVDEGTVERFTLKLKPDIDKDEIKAGDLVVSEEEFRNRVHILNPDLTLLTKGNGSKAQVDLKIKCGYGVYYSTSREVNKIEEGERSYMTVNSIYSPVIKAHAVTREGTNKMFENLDLTIETTGAISPTDALSTACAIVSTYADLIGNVATLYPMSKSVKQPVTSVGAEELKTAGFNEDQLNTGKQTPIEDGKFTPVVYNYLKQKNITTLEQLSEMNKRNENKDLINLLLNEQTKVYTSESGNGLTSTAAEIRENESSIIKQLNSIGFRNVKSNEEDE